MWHPSRILSRTLGTALMVSAVLSTLAVDRVTAQPAQRKVTTVTAVMDWPTPWMGWSPWLVADAKGYFRQAGINLKLIIPATVADPAKVLGSGKADVAFTTILDVIEARVQGAPIAGVGAYAQWNNWGIITWSKSKLAVNDLKGKSIGVYPDAWTKTQLTIMLQRVGIGINQVKLVYNSSNTVPLLLAGKVDAITGITNAEMTQAEVDGKRAATIYLANKYGVPNSYVQVLAANRNFLTKEPGVARAWLKAVKRGMAYASAHPMETWRIFKQRYPTALQQPYAVKSWERTTALFRGPNTHKRGLLWQVASAWNETQRVLKRYKIIDRTVPVNQLFTNTYL